MSKQPSQSNQSGPSVSDRDKPASRPKPKARTKAHQKSATQNRPGQHKPRPEQPMVVLFNKPYMVLTQFTDADNRQTLADYIPLKDIYAAGRLDRDSEGLLVLTNDGRLQHQIADPSNKTHKTYWVQVEGSPDQNALQQLRQGVKLNDGLTRPAEVNIIEPPAVWPRQPPIRERQAIPTTWLALTISEGRNRQVRRMTAAVGYPTLRLIRYRVGEWTLDGIASGEYQQLPWPRQ